tara:strand:- start:55 stop:741 length:687 start_codon:yes stop_codon:yes gene_type:complete
MDKLTLEETLEKINDRIGDREEVNKLLHYCMDQIGKIDRTFTWKTLFDNMINIGIVDDDDASKEYLKGLSDFYSIMLEEVREIEAIDTSFIGESTGMYDTEVFHDNLVIGICLLNEVKCYEEEELNIIKKLGGCILRKYKYDADLNKMLKLGDVSHLFNDPIDVAQREKAAEKNRMELTRSLEEQIRPTLQEPDTESFVTLSTIDSNGCNSVGSGSDCDDSPVEEDSR